MPSSAKPALTPPVKIRCLQEPGREVVSEEDQAQYHREWWGLQHAGASMPIWEGAEGSSHFSAHQL